MSSVNPISASCQSIASTTHASSSLGVGSPRTTTTTTTHYIPGTGSLGRIKYHYNKQKSLEGSDEEFDLSQLSHSTHVLERVKSDRFLAWKPDVDRRRRTIIVEKKNDSYGFTLQSYGIHYKKEQEVEMITYVDYVEYDGPAYRSGMREGDVILSINGVDMEKADHKTIVDFIKSCESRMRMVLLFEDCVRKVELHMRYIQLQNALQNKMNELERICLRERELLEGKWKTHSLPARKKTTTSPNETEYGVAPTDAELQNATYYRPTFSTEDVANIARQQAQQTIIPPPAQYMLTYHYLNPSYRYVLKPTTAGGSTEYFITLGDGTIHNINDQHFIPISRAESLDATTSAATTQLYSQQQRKPAGPPPVPPPRTCEKHKPPEQQKHSDSKQKGATEIPPKSQKSGRHCHGHSCNPCIGNFKWKSADKSAAAGNGAGSDNVSLDAYDLASPCCDTHCVPSRRRNRQHKEHTHKHKHRDRERDSKERAPRPKSQSHVSPSNARHIHHHHHHGAADNNNVEAAQQHQHHHHHTSGQHHHHHHAVSAQQQQQQPQQSYESKSGSLRSRYYDLTAGLASHCSLHSCTSSEFAAADSTSYTTSLSTDTLYWDPQSENAASRQHSTKSRQSYMHATQQQYHQQHQQQQQQQQYQHQHSTPQQHHHQQQEQQKIPMQATAHHIQGVYQHRYHITATQIQPSQIYPNTTTFVHKPKSWDNLTTKAIGGYGFGYGYLDTVAMKPPIKLEIAQQRHSMPRKTHYGRYSTYTDVENYAPPPSQFVEELTTTTTTMITTTKSADDLLASPILAQPTCDCASRQINQQATGHVLNNKPLNPCPGNSSLKYAHYNNCHAGYYSHLPRPTIDAATSTASSTTLAGSNNLDVDVATVSEVTRL